MVQRNCNDSLSSHLNKNILTKCKTHEIKFVLLASNTMNLTQFLDVAYFAPMKRKWRKILGDWKMTVDGRKNATLPKSKFPCLLKKQ